MSELKDFISHEKIKRGLWRLTNFAYLRDGYKMTLSSLWLKIIGITFTLIFFIVTLFSSSQEDEQVTIAGIIAVPMPTANQQKIVIEAFDGNKDRQKAKEQERNSRIVPAIDKIRPVSLIESKRIPTGSEITAVLVSGGSNGILKARVTQGLDIEGDQFIENGAILFGHGSSSEDRLYIQFTKLIHQDRREEKIKAQAFDFKDKILGLRGEKMSDAVFKIAASSGLIFLGGLADSLQADTGGLMLGMSPRKKSLQDAALGGVAQASIEQGKNIMQSMNSAKSVVEVKQSSSLIVIFGDGETNE